MRVKIVGKEALVWGWDMNESCCKRIARVLKVGMICLESPADALIISIIESRMRWWSMNMLIWLVNAS
jgi:hypothetical protein